MVLGEAFFGFRTSHSTVMPMLLLSTLAFTKVPHGVDYRGGAILANKPPHLRGW